MSPYEQLMVEIEALRRRADELRARAVADEIARMKQMIRVYGITAEDLGLVARSGTSKTPARVQYADGEGRVWGGRGPRPKWLKVLIARGVPLDALRLAPAASGSAPAGGGEADVVQRPVRTPPSGSREVKYHNDKGETWCGRGPRPKWLRAALQEGRALSEFATK